MTGELLLGVDIGTASTKGVLCTPDGAVLRTESVPHAVSMPHPGWAEQDADAVWWGDLVTVVRRLLDGEWSGADVAAVAVSAIGPCTLPLDASDRPLRPGILYGVDTRATDQIAELEAELGVEELYLRGGMRLSSQAVGPKVRWLQQHEPDVWRRTATVTTASSYLVHRLTGEHVVDRHTAGHFLPMTDLARAQWHEPWHDLVMQGRALPRLAWSDELAGSVSAQAADETGLRVGTPVAVGAVDALSEAVSVGVREPGDLMVMYGSTAFFILVTDRPCPDPRLWNVPGAFAGQFNLAAGTATAGAATAWFRDELGGGADFSTLFAEADRADPGEVLVLPYLAGERTPLNDPLARGAVLGLTLGTTRGQLFRGLLEGVAFGVRHNLDAFAEAGAPVRRLVAVGGGTQDATWPQVVSDVLGAPQELPEVTLGAAYGDAWLAGRLSGLVTESWARPARVVEPDPSRTAVYAERYADYLALHASTRDLQHRLARGGRRQPVARWVAKCPSTRLT